ncbi:hypothetical protein A9Q98_08455 [Thalassotalea sp. 42_200_T64]|nr:hypothetical protein A9Q98_08455 [Thalassotalea sp. 42_200_T64]
MKINKLLFLTWLFGVLLFPIHGFAADAGAAEEDFRLYYLLLVSIMLLGAYLIFSSKAINKRRYERLKFASQPIFVTNSNGQILFANDEVIKLTAQPFNSLQSASIFELINGLPNCLLNNIQCRNIKSNELCSCEKLNEDEAQFSLITKHDEELPVNISVLRQKGGVFIYYLQELSSIRQLEKQLELQNKVATLGEFLAGILHEVGNPMAAIEGIANNQIWQIENQTEQLSLTELKQQLQIIQTQASRVNQVKNEFSRISGDSQNDSFELVDMANLLEQLVDLAKFDKRSHGIKFNFEIQQQLPAVNTQLSKVTQILLNVLSNAMDALHEQTDPCICCSVCIDQDYLKINITDNGPGIDSALLDKIFEPFYTTKAKGTGLGLMICKRLSDSISAKIEIHSKVGDNTQVNLYLPLNNGEQ